MAKVLPTTTELIELAEIKAGQPIAVGVRDEMALINQQTSRVFSASVPTNRVVLSSEATNTFTTLPGANTIISEGKIRVWGDNTRFRVSIEGQNVIVDVKIGGVLLGAATSTIYGFYSGAVTKITGAAIVDGMTTVIIEARSKASPNVLNHVTVEEFPVLLADMPTPADPALELNYWQLDDEMFQALEPLDEWALQALDDGVEAQKYHRAPGVLHCLNGFDQFHYLSSINWRCDGPYMIAAPPWSETATVIITAKLENLLGNVEIIVYSEHERFDDVQDRIQILTLTSTADLRFDGIKLRPAASGAKPQLIWIAFRSDTDDIVKNFTTKVGHYGLQKPWRLYCENLFSSYVNWPRGLAGFGQGDSSTLTFKQSFSFGEPTDFFDIATVEGLEIVTTSGTDTARQPILISPHAGTGHLTAPQFENVTDPNAGIIAQAQFDVYDIGTAILLGVYIEASVTPTDRRHFGFPGDPPSASLLAEIAGNLNATARYLTPQLITRHSGARNIKDAALSTNNIYAQGHYWFLPVIFTPGPVFIPHTIEIALGGDPNWGAVSGLLVDTVYAQMVYMVTSIITAVTNTDNLIAMYFTGETLVTDLAPILPVGGGFNQPSPTIADATLAAVSGSQDPATPVSPVDMYENDYSQQYTWPSDTFKTESPWTKSPIVSTTLPGTFPTKLVLNIENQGGRLTDKNYLTTTTLIVAGLCVWCGPRNE